MNKINIKNKTPINVFTNYFIKKKKKKKNNRQSSSSGSEEKTHLFKTFYLICYFDTKYISVIKLYDAPVATTLQHTHTHTHATQHNTREPDQTRVRDAQHKTDTHTHTHRRNAPCNTNQTPAATV